MWTIFKVYVEFASTLLLFYVLVFWGGPKDMRSWLQPGIEPTTLSSPVLAGGFFTTIATWEAQSATISPCISLLGLSKLSTTVWVT